MIRPVDLPNSLSNHLPYCTLIWQTHFYTGLLVILHDKMHYDVACRDSDCQAPTRQCSEQRCSRSKEHEYGHIEIAHLACIITGSKYHIRLAIRNKQSHRGQKVLQHYL